MQANFEFTEKDPKLVTGLYLNFRTSLDVEIEHSNVNEHKLKIFSSLSDYT